MKFLAAAAGALLIASCLNGCSRSDRHPASAIEAAAAARKLALEKARAAAAARDQDRQQLETIPPPSKTTYMAIHTRQGWANPFLIVGKSSVNLTVMYPDLAPANTPGSDFLHPAAARRRVLDLRLADLPEALAALPENTWPYGRVVAVEEDSLEQKQDRPQVRRNVEATMQVLNDLGVVIYEWPAAAAR
jgi:hypothetical protein